MALLPTRTFASLSEGFAAGVQGRARALADFSVGSVLRSVGEATADLLLWLQSLVAYVLTLTRAGTSSGEDLDSWMADFAFPRLGARAATGVVTLGRLGLTTSTLVIAPGAMVRTVDGSQSFVVTEDRGNGAWSSAAGGYLLLAGAASVADIPVAALGPGVQGNVAASTIGEITSALPGIDTVTNPAGFTDGEEAESDPSYRARFVLHINALGRATVPAIRSAIADLELGLTCEIDESPGFVAVYVDDGSGAPSAALVRMAAAAVEAVRAAGVQVAVFGAARLSADVAMSVEVAAGYVAADVVAAVTAALAVFIDGLGAGEKLPYGRLTALAFAASPGVTNVAGVRLDGGVADLVPARGERIKAGTLVVSPAAGA